MAGAGDGTAGSPVTLDINLLSPGTSSAAKPGRRGEGAATTRSRTRAGRAAPKGRGLNPRSLRAFEQRPVGRPSSQSKGQPGASGGERLSLGSDRRGPDPAVQLPAPSCARPGPLADLASAKGPLRRRSRWPPGCPPQGLPRPTNSLGIRTTGGAFLLCAVQINGHLARGSGEQASCPVRRRGPLSGSCWRRAGVPGSVPTWPALSFPGFTVRVGEESCPSPHTARSVSRGDADPFLWGGSKKQDFLDPRCFCSACHGHRGLPAAGAPSSHTVARRGTP